MSERIPFLDLQTLHQPLLPTLRQLFDDIVARSAFVGGQYIADFERAFAAFCNTSECVGVGNGTDALMLALRALGVGAGDFVVVPAFSFVATAEAVSMLGAMPRFVDIDPVIYTMDPLALENVDPKGVKAVIPVHLFGQAADMEPITAIAQSRGWHVVEDCAQAHGALYHHKPVGSFGDLAAFSFYPSKNLGAMGDAGAVVGSQAAWLANVRRVANHGRSAQYEHSEPGVNSRLDAIQAAVLGLKLPHVNDWNTRRARVAGWYNERLTAMLDVESASRFLHGRDVVLPEVGSGRTHVYHLYTLQVPERAKAVAALHQAGIGCGVYYDTPLHLQAAYRNLGYERGAFVVTERVSDRCLSLPMDPNLREDQVDRVVRVIVQHLRAGA